MSRFLVLLLAAGALTTLSAATAVAATPKPLTVTIVVTKKGVPGGPRRISVKKGRTVALVVRSALAGEVHVHGYNLGRVVRAGGTARITFRARLAGRFEIELHGRVPLLLGSLSVSP